MSSLAASILKAAASGRTIDTSKVIDIRSRSGKIIRWTDRRKNRLATLCQSHSREEVMMIMGLTESQYDQAVLRFDIDTPEKRTRRANREARK
ncbi:hypothetical protein S8a_00059 [Klebsiella phage VLCpiS8a]|nr:hypothetical protein S8a_00059 [Klebsiella phage VLCpiS8a]